MRDVDGRVTDRSLVGCGGGCARGGDVEGDDAADNRDDPDDRREEAEDGPEDDSPRLWERLRLIAFGGA